MIGNHQSHTYGRTDRRHTMAKGKYCSVLQHGTVKGNKMWTADFFSTLCSRKNVLKLQKGQLCFYSVELVSVRHLHAILNWQLACRFSTIT